MQNKPVTGKCPLCGTVNKFVPNPDKPGRIVMFCQCNPTGAVVETDDPNVTVPAPVESEEKE